MASQSANESLIEIPLPSRVTKHKTIQISFLDKNSCRQFAWCWMYFHTALLQLAKEWHQDHGLTNVWAMVRTSSKSHVEEVFYCIYICELCIFTMAFVQSLAIELNWQEQFATAVQQYGIAEDIKTVVTLVKTTKVVSVDRNKHVCKTFQQFVSALGRSCRKMRTCERFSHKIQYEVASR